MCRIQLTKFYASESLSDDHTLYAPTGYTRTPPLGILTSSPQVHPFFCRKYIYNFHDGSNKTLIASWARKIELIPLFCAANSLRTQQQSHHQTEKRGFEQAVDMPLRIIRYRRQQRSEKTSTEWYEQASTLPKYEVHAEEVWDHYAKNCVWYFPRLRQNHQCQRWLCRST